jgi:hypothetical protein
MKKTVITFGLISSAILASMLTLSVSMMKSRRAMDGSMFIGYLSMLIAFVFIFVAIKSYRDRYLGGNISFGKAFQVGASVALIASLAYTLTWVILYKNFYPAFMEDYATWTMNAERAKGASEAALTKMSADMANTKKMYDTWPGLIGFTLMEVLPLSLIVSLIAAAVLKRKTAKHAAVLQGA